MNRSLSSRLWRLFWVIAILQAIDLATTYLILLLGGREGNIFMRRMILTPVAPLAKALALVFFAVLIMRASSRGRPSPSRLIVAAYVVIAAYTVVTVNNVAILVLH